MTRRQALEPEELFDAADRLKAEGKVVSATALLDSLGGGSLRTIYKLLEAWEQRQPAISAAAISSEIPADVMAGFSNSWRLAAQAAERNIQAAKEKAAEEVSAAISKFQVALDASDRLEAENEELALEIENLKARTLEVEATAHAVQAESAAHKATIEQLERQIGKQENDLEKAEAASKSDRAERDAALKEAAELKGQVDALKEQYSKLLTAVKSGEKN